MGGAERRFLRRKRYFLKKSFQIKFLTGFVLLLLAQAVLIGVLFMAMSRQTITTGYSGARFVIDRTPNFFLLNFAVMSAGLCAVIALAGIIVFIFLSHRIAGPLWRFEKTLRDLTEGKFAGRIKLRRADQLTELQNLLNAALGEMGDRLKEIKRDVKEAHDLASHEDSEKRMRDLRNTIARIKERLAFFKTDD